MTRPRRKSPFEPDFLSFAVGPTAPSGFEYCRQKRIYAQLDPARRDTFVFGHLRFEAGWIMHLVRCGEARPTVDRSRIVSRFKMAFQEHRSRAILDDVNTSLSPVSARMSESAQHHHRSGRSPRALEQLSNLSAHMSVGVTNILL